MNVYSSISYSLHITPLKIECLEVKVEVNLRSTVSRSFCLGVGLQTGAHNQIFVFRLTIEVSWCGTPSLTRGWVCNLFVQLLLGLARAVTLGSNSYRTHMRLPQPVGPGPHICIPQEQVAQLYPRALGSRFFASYDSQGYSGGILNRLQTGRLNVFIYIYIQLVPRRKRIKSVVKRTTG
jgi:hypothetical protein